MTAADGPRVEALSLLLAETHDELLEHLRALQAGAGGVGAGPAATWPLRTHCLAFCQALTRHHLGESRSTFPQLAGLDPVLRPVLARLEEDHVLIGDIVSQVERLVAGLPDHPTAAQLARFRSELGGLAAIMESHFRYEERVLADVLDGPGSATTRRRRDLSRSWALQ